MAIIRRSSRRSRPDSWSALDTSSISTDAMSIAASELSTSSRPRSSRYTGFPEGFDGNRNTTLPHPDADTSPNACIIEEDIAVSRALSRQRRSFLDKYKRTTSHGFLEPEAQQMYSGLVAASSNTLLTPGLDSATLPTIPGTPAALGRPPSNDSGDSLVSNSTNGGVSPKSPSRGRHFRNSLSISSDAGASIKAGRRRSLLERFGLRITHHE